MCWWSSSECEWQRRKKKTICERREKKTIVAACYCVGSPDFFVMQHSIRIKPRSSPPVQIKQNLPTATATLRNGNSRRDTHGTDLFAALPLITVVAALVSVRCLSQAIESPAAKSPIDLLVIRLVRCLLAHQIFRSRRHSRFCCG